MPDTPTPVSFAELRDHPERYEGQEVVLAGFIDLCWEGGWLSQTESAWPSGPRARDIRVQPSTRIDADSYDGTFGRVYGIVLTNRKPWHPILGVTHVLPLRRFRERFEVKEFTGTLEELFEAQPELRQFFEPTEPSTGAVLAVGE